MRRGQHLPTRCHAEQAGPHFQSLGLFRIVEGFIGKHPIAQCALGRR